MERRDHLVRGHAGGRGIPERKIGKPVGVDMLRAFFQLGERRQGVAGRGVLGIVDLDEDGFVALDDQRVGDVETHAEPLPTAAAGTPRHARPDPLT